MIQCVNVTKSYFSDGKLLTAVDHASFSVKKGDFILILGHSGSGKTTLLSLLGGLTSPDSGEVLVNGQENWQQSDDELSHVRNKSIGFIFQFASLIPTLTVLENILLPLSFSIDPAGDRRLAMELLDLVGLRDKQNVFPSQLSGGQQRRVAIARAFINRPDIILADEPTGDLDEETESDILDIFSRYNREQKTTFMIVTHNRELARKQPDCRIFTMRQGALTEQEKAA